MNRQQRVVMVHQALDAVLAPGLTAAPTGQRLRVEPGLAPAKAPATSSTLFDAVSRAKALWLKRAMYHAKATSTEKCFAYLVADHLNCVTLDCWPSQFRCARLLGFKVTRTVQRAARGLEGWELLRITTAGKSGCRYAPIFLDSEFDKPVTKSGHVCRADPDAHVRESFLEIHINKSEPTQKSSPDTNHNVYERRKRGAIEMEIVKLLGADGVDILQKLGSLDDGIVDRLCRAFIERQLGERELIAARLAANQFGDVS